MKQWQIGKEKVIEVDIYYLDTRERRYKEMEKRDQIEKERKTKREKKRGREEEKERESKRERKSMI